MDKISVTYKKGYYYPYTLYIKGMYSGCYLTLQSLVITYLRLQGIHTTFDMLLEINSSTSDISKNNLSAINQVIEKYL